MTRLSAVWIRAVVWCQTPRVHLSKERNHDSHFKLVKEEVEHPGCVAIKDSHGGFLR